MATPERSEIRGARLWPASGPVTPEGTREVISRCNECCDTGGEDVTVIDKDNSSCLLV
jgi:hypothetical protein